MRSTQRLNCRLVDVQQKLEAQGQAISLPVISRLLQTHDYHLPVNVKEDEGPSQPERDRQFQYIRAPRAPHQPAGQPCLSVDTKKKELIGNFKQPGRSGGTTAEWVKV